MTDAQRGEHLKASRSSLNGTSVLLYISIKLIVTKTLNKTHHTYILKLPFYIKLETLTPMSSYIQANHKMNTHTKNDQTISISKEEEAAAQQEIWKYVFGFTPMAVIKCAIELGIPDIIESHEIPITLDELASKLGCSTSLLHRIMRFLVQYKIFQEKPVSETRVGYTNTPLSRLLTRHGNRSMADFVLLESSPIMLAPWHKLSARVLGKEESAFGAAHGDDVWGFAAANPEHSKLIDNAMACDARVAVGAMIEGCPEVFKGLRTLVDIGGGDGTALRLIVEACPWISGINFDLPHVVSVAPACKGVEHVGGDMFDHVPKADAAYLMVSIFTLLNVQFVSNW